MTHDQIARLARRVARTLETELDCGECGQQVAAYVDALMTGSGKLEEWALIRQHFEQCSACGQEFAVLKEVAKMDLEDTWPSLAVLVQRAGKIEPNVPPPFPS